MTALFDLPAASDVLQLRASAEAREMQASLRAYQSVLSRCVEEYTEGGQGLLPPFEDDTVSHYTLMKEVNRRLPAGYRVVYRGGYNFHGHFFLKVYKPSSLWQASLKYFGVM